MQCLDASRHQLSIDFNDFTGKKELACNRNLIIDLWRKFPQTLAHGPHHQFTRHTHHTVWLAACRFPLTLHSPSQPAFQLITHVVKLLNQHYAAGVSTLLLKVKVHSEPLDQAANVLVSADRKLLFLRAELNLRGLIPDTG